MSQSPPWTPVLAPASGDSGTSSFAVLSRPSYVSLHGFEIHGRSLSWFKNIHPAVDPAPDKRIYGLRALPAPLALADSYGDPKGWHPDMDDLDIPQQDLASIGTAARLLGVVLPPPLVREIKKAAKTFDRLEVADDVDDSASRHSE
jgi:hypothetical protein